MTRKSKIDVGPEFNCLRLEHREGYARYLRGRSLDEVREFLDRMWMDPGRRIHFQRPPDGTEVIAEPEPSDPHFELETDTEEVPF